MYEARWVAVYIPDGNADGAVDLAKGVGRVRVEGLGFRVWG